MLTSILAKNTNVIKYYIRYSYSHQRHTQHFMLTHEQAISTYKFSNNAHNTSIHLSHLVQLKLGYNKNKKLKLLDIISCFFK